MRTLRVAIAAARRYRLEKRIRGKWLAVSNKTKSTQPYHIVLHLLVKKKHLTRSESRALQKEYTRLSKIIHAV